MKGSFDIQKFDSYIETHLRVQPNSQESLAEYFDVYIKALYYSLHGMQLDTSQNRIVEKSVENAEFALDLKAIFPDVVFVHIVRNPYANLVSIRKYKTSEAYPYIVAPFRALYNSYYFLHRNRRLIKDYYVVKYEDLVVNPRETVEAICKFVDVDFDDNMLLPTKVGRLWEGNSTSSIQFTGISPDRINSWQAEITPVEVALVNRYLKHVVAEFSYNLYKTKRSVFFPVKKEGFKQYLANRLLWKMG